MKRANLGDVDYADLGLDGLPKRHCNDRTPEDQMNCPQVLISTRFANSKPNSQLPVPKRAADIWQIIIQTETGQQFTVDIPPFHTIKNLKEIIATKTNIPPDRQSLIFKGEKLTLDDCMIASYNHTDSVHMVVRLYRQ